MFWCHSVSGKSKAVAGLQPFLEQSVPRLARPPLLHRGASRSQSCGSGRPNPGSLCSTTGLAPFLSYRLHPPSLWSSGTSRGQHSSLFIPGRWSAGSNELGSGPATSFCRPRSVMEGAARWAPTEAMDRRIFYSVRPVLKMWQYFILKIAYQDHYLYCTDDCELCKQGLSQLLHALCCYS